MFSEISLLIFRLRVRRKANFKYQLYIYIYTCNRVCMHVCMYVCMYVCLTVILEVLEKFNLTWYTYYLLLGNEQEKNNFSIPRSGDGTGWHAKPLFSGSLTWRVTISIGFIPNLVAVSMKVIRDKQNIKTG